MSTSELVEAIGAVVMLGIEALALSRLSTLDIRSL